MKTKEQVAETMLPPSHDREHKSAQIYRIRKMTAFTLSDDANDLLNDLANKWGITRSRAIEKCILTAAKRAK